MLTAIKPSDVLNHWDKIEACLNFIRDNTLQTVRSKEQLNAVIRNALLKGEATLWALFNEEEQIKAIVITTFIGTSFLMKSLNIYALMSFEKIDDEEYIKGFEILKNFAKRNNCDVISAESSNSFIIEKFKSLGGLGYSLNLYWEI